MNNNMKYDYENIFFSMTGNTIKMIGIIYDQILYSWGGGILIIINCMTDIYGCENDEHQPNLESPL